MKRYVSFKKGGTLVSFGATGYTAYSQLPIDSPIQFNVNSEFFTPVQDLLNYLSNAISDTPLGIISAGADAANMLSNLTGASLKPRPFFAQAWKDTKPLEFTIGINLKFGWRGDYAALNEVYAPVEKLINLSLPDYFGEDEDKKPIRSKSGLSIIRAPGPNGISVVTNAINGIVSQMKEALGPLGDLLLGQKQSVFEDDMSDPDSRFLVVSYDFETNEFVPLAMIGGKQQKPGETDESLKTAAFWYKLPPAEEYQGALAAFNAERKSGFVPTETYSLKVTGVQRIIDDAKAGVYDKGSLIAEQSASYGHKKAIVAVESKEMFTRNAMRSTLYSKKAGYEEQRVLLIPLNKKTKTSSKGNAPANLTATEVDKTGTWDVSINGIILLSNLVLSSVSYTFGNEQDSSGYPSTGQINLSFITQEIPVYKGKENGGFNFMAVGLGKDGKPVGF